jgi:hypothetical protein
MPRDLTLVDKDGDYLNAKKDYTETVLEIGGELGSKLFDLHLNNATTLHAWLGEYIREELTK